MSRGSGNSIRVAERIVHISPVATGQPFVGDHLLATALAGPDEGPRVLDHAGRMHLYNVPDAELDPELDPGLVPGIVRWLKELGR